MHKKPTTLIALFLSALIVFSGLNISAAESESNDIGISFNKNTQVVGDNADSQKSTNEYLYLDAKNPATVIIKINTDKMGAYGFYANLAFTDFDGECPYYVKNFSVDYEDGTSKTYVLQNNTQSADLLGEYGTDEINVKYKKKISDIILKKGTNTVKLTIASDGDTNDIKLYGITAQKYSSGYFADDESGTIKIDSTIKNAVPFETKTDKYGISSVGAVNLRGTSSAPNYATFMINTKYDTYEIELNVNPYVYGGDGKFGFRIYVDDMSNPVINCLNAYDTEDYPVKRDKTLLINKFLKIDNGKSSEHLIKIAFIKNTSSIMHIKNIVMKKITSVTPKTDKRYDYVENMLTDYDDLFLGTVAIAENSPVIKVHGGLRYIDYNNTEKVPLKLNNVLYLPLKTFADSFGYYYETNTDLKYCFLRTNTKEYAYKNGKFYTSRYRGGFTETECDWVMQGGEWYIPFEKYACDGDITTFVLNNTVFADTAENIEKIKGDGENLSKLSAEFESFSNMQKGNVYYVSKAENSSDDNDGSKNKPFNTLSKAAEAAAPGDVVIVGDGIYRETLKPATDGKDNAPILYIADEGASPVISALEHIGNYTVTESGLWCFDLNFNLGMGRNELFVNNKAIAEGRHPNADSIDKRYRDFNLNLCDLWPVTGDIKISPDNGKLATSASVLNQPDNYWAGATLVSMHGSGYSLGTAKITASANGSLTLGDTTYVRWFDSKAASSDFAFITNSLNTVDSPGEWYISDENKLYFYPASGVSANDIELKKRQLAIDLTDRKNIIVSGINTIGGSILMKNSEMCSLLNGKFEYTSHYTYATDQHYGYFDTQGYDGNWDVDISGTNGAPQRGEDGIYISGTNNSVIGCTVKYSAGAGLYLTGLNTYIADNCISQCGYAGGWPGGIYIMPSPSEQRITEPRGSYAIYRNTISETGRSGIGFSAAEALWFYSFGICPFLPCDIAYNDIKNASVLARDTGAVYIHGVNLGYKGYKTQIHNNTVSNSLCYSAQNHGMYFDNFTVNVNCYSNVLFKSSDWGEIAKSCTIYMQPIYSFPDAYAEIDEWDNSSVWYKTAADKTNLNESDFPCGLPFETGKGIESTANYHRVISGEFTDLSSPVRLKKDESVVFKNVKFSADNSLEIIFSGDAANTGDCIKTDIYKDGELICQTAQNIYAKTPSGEYSQGVTVPLKTLSGTYDVKITCKAAKSAEIWSVNPKKAADDVYAETAQSKIYFGNYTNLTYSSPHYNKDKHGTPGRVVYNPQRSHDKSQMMADRANFSPVYMFENVYVTGDTAKFKLCYPGYAPHAGGAVLEVYVDSLTTEPVAKIELNKTSTTDYSVISTDLTKNVSEGLHNIYIKINANRTDRSYTLWWFGFDGECTGINSVTTDDTKMYVNCELPNLQTNVCIMGIYDLSGNLIDVKTLKSEADAVFNKPSDGTYRLKLFVLESINNIKPIGRAKSYRYEIK